MEASGSSNRAIISHAGAVFELLSEEPNTQNHHEIKRGHSSNTFTSLSGIKEKRPNNSTLTESISTLNRSNSNSTVESTSSRMSHISNNPFYDEAINLNIECNISNYLAQYKSNAIHTNLDQPIAFYKKSNHQRNEIKKKLEESVDSDIRKLTFEMLYLEAKNKEGGDAQSILDTFFETLKDRKNGTFENFEEKIKSLHIQIPYETKKRLYKLFNKISPKNDLFHTKSYSNEILDTVESKIIAHQNFLGDLGFVNNILSTFTKKDAQRKINLFLQQNDKILNIERKFKKPEDREAEYDKFYQKINKRLFDIKSNYAEVVEYIKERNDITSPHTAYKSVKKLVKIDPIFRSGQKKMSEDITETLKFFRKKSESNIQKKLKKTFKKSYNGPIDMGDNTIQGMKNKLDIIELLHTEMSFIKENTGRQKGTIPSLSWLHGTLLNKPAFIEKIQTINSIKNSEEAQYAVTQEQIAVNLAFNNNTAAMEILDFNHKNLIATKDKVNAPEYRVNVLKAHASSVQAFQNANQADIQLQEAKNKLMATQAYANQSQRDANSKFIIYDILCNIMSDIR